MTLYCRAADMVRLAQRLDATTTCAFLFEKNTTMNSIEYLIHEIGHALSVHVKPFPVVLVGGLPQRRMSTVVAAILHRRSDKGVRNECLVLAAEAAILPRLGLHVDTECLVELGVDQGVKPDKLRAEFGSPASRRLAVAVLRYVGRRVGIASSKVWKETQ